MGNVIANHIINHLSTLAGGEMLSLSQGKLITLTQSEVNEIRESLNQVLTNPYELLVPLSQRHPLKELSEIKKTFFLIRGICRKILETVTTIQIGKDLTLLLFDQVETTPIEQGIVPNFPRTRYDNDDMLIATHNYLLKPRLRLGTTNEFVMLTDVIRFTTGEIMYIFAEYAPGLGTRKKRGYFPDSTFHTPLVDDLESVEIRTADGNITLGYKSEQYRYYHLGDKFLINLMDMAVESGKNQTMSPDIFQGKCLARYIASYLFKQEKEKRRITFDESFYIYGLQTFDQSSNHHDEVLDGFIETFGLPLGLKNIQDYCYNWVKRHCSEGKITQQQVNLFIANAYRDPRDHKTLLGEIRNIFDLFRKKHYLPDQIMMEIIQIRQPSSTHSPQRSPRQAK